MQEDERRTGPPLRLLIASRNASKRAELEALLAGLDVEILTPADFPGAPEAMEDGETFEENAARKAREMALFCRVYTVADDSGLCVDALGGRPGVRSARYAGANPTAEKLCRKLLDEMQTVPDGKRTARFQCCIALGAPDGEILLTCRGTCEGVILREMRGTHGFGYDPVFFYPPARKTFAEMAPDNKNAVSHRGRALGRFREDFTAFLRKCARADSRPS